MVPASPVMAYPTTWSSSNAATYRCVGVARRADWSPCRSNRQNSSKDCWSISSSRRWSLRRARRSRTNGLETRGRLAKLCRNRCRHSRSMKPHSTKASCSIEVSALVTIGPFVDGRRRRVRSTSSRSSMRVGTTCTPNGADSRRITRTPRWGRERRSSNMVPRLLWFPYARRL